MTAAHPRIRNSRRYPTRTWLESYPRGHPRPTWNPPTATPRARPPPRSPRRTRNEREIKRTSASAHPLAHRTTPRATRARGNAPTRRTARPPRADAPGRRFTRRDATPVARIVPIADISMRLNFPSTYPADTPVVSVRVDRQTRVQSLYLERCFAASGWNSRFFFSSARVGNWMVLPFLCRSACDATNKNKTRRRFSFHAFTLVGRLDARWTDE